jgi:hypothetical protein
LTVGSVAPRKEPFFRSFSAVSPEPRVGTGVNWALNEAQGELVECDLSPSRFLITVQRISEKDWG